MFRDFPVDDPPGLVWKRIAEFRWRLSAVNYFGNVIPGPSLGQSAIEINLAFLAPIVWELTNPGNKPFPAQIISHHIGPEVSVIAVFRLLFVVRELWIILDLIVEDYDNLLDIEDESSATGQNDGYQKDDMPG